MLGDPGGRDAAIHAIQVCVPHYTLLPVGVEQMVQKKALRSTPCFMQARERSHKGDTFVYDVEIFDRQGRVLEFWRGLTLRRVGDEIPIENIPVSLLEPLQERKREEATSLLVEDSNASI
jgi:enediyne polyketide synthase